MYWQVNADTPGVIGPMDTGDKWFFMPNNVPKDLKLTNSEAADLIRRATGIDLPYEVLSTDEWVASRLFADKYRDRRVFLAGVMTGFADKLARQGVEHRREGLVWVGDADLGAYFKKRHRHVRHVRFSGQRKNEAYVHGKAAGGRIVLRKGVSTSASSNGRLLPGKSS
jgi:hypothetical protein